MPNLPAMKHVKGPALNAPDADTLARFAKIVGEKYALRADADKQPYLVEWRDMYRGASPLVLRPGRVEEVSAILALASDKRVGIVPQGGNTGLVGAQTPSPAGDQIVLSLGRMNRVLDVDAAGNTLTAEAGCTLQQLQEAADAADRLFPLSLGAEGTCQIGGNISTNAGGVAVLAYGNTRDLVLGIEAVLADGRVWNGLKRLRKDNTGYDLKHLFIGGEGTLGIVTKAVLKLFPKPVSRETAMVGVASPADAVALLRRAQAAFGGGVTSFELISRIAIEFIVRHAQDARDPLQDAHPWYVLMEVSSGEPSKNVRPRLEDMLAAAMEAGEARDAILPASQAQAKELWHMRAILSEMQKFEGGSIKHDVSVPVHAVPAFIDEADTAVTDLVPGARPVAFGHLGDGNIHYNVSQPVGADMDTYMAGYDRMNEVVHTIVAKHDGSISAEHGIGILKRDLLPGVKAPLELELMRSIKRAFDPNGILNPGKLLPE